VSTENEHTEAADTFVADPAPDTVIVPDVAQSQAPDLAWSSDADTADYGASTERYTWRAAWVRAAAFAVGCVVVAATIGGVWAWQRSARTHPAEPTPRPAAAPAGQVLDGIYEIASDDEHRTVNGVPQPSMDVTRYWAFRSVCTTTGCVATAAEVDDINHQIPSADHDHSVWRWNFGGWTEDPDHNTSPCGSTANSPQSTATMVRTLAPRPDGTFTGMETDTVDNDSPCGAGAVIHYSITAKRIGDTPPGVVADPSAAPVNPPAGGNQYVAIALSPSASTHKAGAWGTGETADNARRIALNACREHTGDDDCVVAETNLHGCVTYALAPDGSFAGGKGPDLDSARADARANLPSSYWVSDVQCSQ
jgi:hypothetical protein